MQWGQTLRDPAGHAMHTCKDTFEQDQARASLALAARDIGKIDRIEHHAITALFV